MYHVLCTSTGRQNDNIASPLGIARVTAATRRTCERRYGITVSNVSPPLKQRFEGEALHMNSALYGVGVSAMTAQAAEQIPSAVLHPTMAAGAARAATVPNVKPAAA